LTDDRQRIDKWLWHARIVRTRSDAAALAASGHVRLNGARVTAASKPVKPGDVVTIALDARVRVLKVTGFALRRGAAEQGRALYEDMAPIESAPAAQPEAAIAQREPGTGRPTKRERRAIERFTRDSD
jgi:ribosome-associated heat shock protein Hsp15